MSTVYHVLLEHKDGESTVQKKGGVLRESGVRSLVSHGDLLQVMDALLVNQTHAEGGEVQDEALVQLEERKRKKEGRDGGGKRDVEGNGENQKIILACVLTKTNIIIIAAIIWTRQTEESCL